MDIITDKNIIEIDKGVYSKIIHPSDTKALQSLSRKFIIELPFYQLFFSMVAGKRSLPQ